MADQMPAVGMERKLAAIFSTDVAGYSRLMGDDEEATIRSLTVAARIPNPSPKKAGRALRAVKGC